MSLPSITTAIPGPASKALAERLENVESPGVTFLSEDFPVFWEKALGANIWDVDGNCFLDLNSAFGVAGIGHTNPKVAKAVSDQASKLIHGMGDVHPPRAKVEFIEKLLSILPKKLNKVILSCNGSDACESALKTAQVFTNKSGVIAFTGAYHGLGYGALDLTYKSHFRKPFTGRLTEHTFHAPYPNTYRDGEDAVQNSLQEVKRIISENQSKLAAIIIEPIQSRGGVITAPEGFLYALREICDEHGLLLIFDEIYTGFARTGKMFAFEHEEVLPDLLCLGKTIGGGLPISICVGTSEVMNAWGKSNGEAIHTSTFLGNPLACTAGLAVLDDLIKSNWPQKVANTGNYLLQKLAGLESTFIGEIRGKGLMIGLELVKDKNTKEPHTDLGNFILEEGLKRGLIILTSGSHGHVLSFSPPFVITLPEIDFAVATIQSLLNEFVRKEKSASLVSGECIRV
ncbi:MAG: aspartate aminotransferase family protein [Candidatus Caenarcaniphilales bacterium]|nr:aspartate aminotransferase family protein [Candidatus Caenarcaniphilales bacterium]